jgi:hypothetical protein
MLPWLILSLLACSTAEEPPAGDDDDDATEALPPEMEQVFSFAILADPHVVGEGEHADRFRQTVDWITDQEDERGIELVFVLGDIGWSGGIELSKSILDELPMTYVPVLGDNPIQVGDQEAWDAVFGPHLDGLGLELDNWIRGPVAGFDAEQDADAWFQNNAFDHRGVRFISLDWNTRHIGGLLGELADVHDHDGGALPFLTDELDGLLDGADENVVMLSHHAMHVPAFSISELDQITAETYPVGHRVFADFAGHYHGDGHEIIEDGGYEVFVTDAVWDDVITIRMVDVWSDGLTFEYRQELVVL